MLECSFFLEASVPTWPSYKCLLWDPLLMKFEWHLNLICYLLFSSKYHFSRWRSGNLEEEGQKRHTSTQLVLEEVLFRNLSISWRKSCKVYSVNIMLSQMQSPACMTSVCGSRCTEAKTLFVLLSHHLKDSCRLADTEEHLEALSPPSPCLPHSAEKTTQQDGGVLGFWWLCTCSSFSASVVKYLLYSRPATGHKV